MKQALDEQPMSASNGAADCIFCQIAAGTTPADTVWEDDDLTIFRDINPKAAIHLLAIPKQHIAQLASITAEHEPLIGKLMHQLVTVARDRGLAEGGFRLIINNGSNAGQEVSHLHVHLLGGEKLGPMRC